MFSIRKYPYVGGAASPVYINPASMFLLPLVGGYWVLLIVSSVGIVVNKITGELCRDLFYFLFVMAFISVVSVYWLEHLRVLSVGSDYQWIPIMSTGLLYITGVGGYLYWGVLNLGYHAGFGSINSGDNSVCTESSLCLTCYPYTYWYSIAAACVTGGLWTGTAVTMYGVLLPSLLAQIFYRARTI